MAALPENLSKSLEATRKWPNMNGGGPEMLAKYGNALYVASHFGDLEVVQLLLDKGANINPKGDQYDSALQAASFEGYLEVVQLLLDEGADNNAQSGEYGSGLQVASARGHEKVVQLLLDKVADTEVQVGRDPQGRAISQSKRRQDDVQEAIRLHKRQRTDEVTSALDSTSFDCTYE